MRPFPLLFGLLFFAGAAAAAPRVTVPPMRTSIYVGSVSLTTGPFVGEPGRLESDYEAKVRPWFFWSESGRIAITLAGSDLERLGRGETVEFRGEAVNQRQKPRSITGRAQPADATSGRIKVRIMVDGLELIFNGTYRLDEPLTPTAVVSASTRASGT